jgi:hypothetical protein
MLVAGASACVDILGDFKEGPVLDGGPGGDAAAGMDASTADGMSNGADGGDGSSPGDGATIDAEAGPTAPPLLRCTQDGTIGATKVFPLLARPNNGDVPDRVYFAGPTTLSAYAYIVVPGGSGGGVSQAADVFRYQPSENGLDYVNLPVPSGQIYNVQRTADGIAVLTFDQNVPGLPGHNQLIVWKLSEAVLEGGYPVWQRIPIGQLDPQPNNGTACHTITAFQVVDATKDDYIAAFSYFPGTSNCTTIAGPPVLFMTRTTANQPDGGSPWVQWTVPAVDAGDGTNAPQTLDFGSDAIIFPPDAGTLFLVADPSGGQPIAGVGPLVWSGTAAIAPGVKGAPLPLQPGTSFAGKLAFEASPVTGKVNAIYLGGDLAALAPTFYAGSIDPAAFTTTNVGGPAYKSTPISFDSLPVDKGRAHWHNYANGNEHVLLVGRNSLDNSYTVGANFFWFDSAGNMRGMQADDAGSTHAALFPTVQVIGADVTFGGSPGIIGGDFLFAITEAAGSDAGTAVYSLTQYHVQCLSK